MMIVIVEKTGIMKQVTIKNALTNSNPSLELYKKCGFKKADDFTKLGEWQANEAEGTDAVIELYGKNVGKRSNKNDTNICSSVYGNCALVLKKEGKYVPLSLECCKKHIFKTPSASKHCDDVKDDSAYLEDASHRNGGNNYFAGIKDSCSQDADVEQVATVAEPKKIIYELTDEDYESE